MIYEFDTYRDYLATKLGAEGSRTGQRKHLAEYIRVHTTFVSQVLKRRAEFSLEQAELINEFLEHTEEESEFFMLLILKDRAGTQKLKNRFEKQIQIIREKRMNIKERIRANEKISDQDREKFYSSYLYGAVHVLSSISQYQNLEAMAQALNLSRTRMREILDFLIRIGIIDEDKSKLTTGKNHIHLASNSELVLKHHANWRMNAISKLQFVNKDNLHYSACLSLSEQDAYKVKESILENLKQNVEIISKSKEEIAYVMNLDFYNLLS